LHLTGERRLAEASGAGRAEIVIASPPDSGVMGGEYFTLKPGGELPGDQRPDDGGSVTFETAPLAEPIELLGFPVLQVTLRCDAPTALLTARLVDVHPDGAARRISLGVLNLAHRDGSAEPRPMPAGEGVRVTLRLDACGYCIPAGHRLRLSLSNAYWPQVLPTPGAAAIALDLSAPAILTLPLLGAHRDIAVPEPADPDPLPRYIEHAPMATRHAVTRDLTAGVSRYTIHEDTGASEHPETGLVTRQLRDEVWILPLADPDKASGECRWTTEMRRGDWSVRTESVATLRCSADAFEIEAVVEAYEGDSLVHRKTWKRSIPRELI
jgi:hypothetical protein